MVHALNSDPLEESELLKYYLKLNSHQIDYFLKQ